MADATDRRTGDPPSCLRETGSHSDVPSCVLVLSAERRVAAIGGEIHAFFTCPSDVLIGANIEAVLPALRRILPDEPHGVPSSASHAQRGGEATLLAQDLEGTPALLPQALTVRLEPLQTHQATGAGWLVRLTVSRQRADVASQAPWDVAAALRADTHDHVAALLAHDLSNTLQALYGSIWLLEDSASESPRSASVMSTLTTAIEQGVATVRLQSDLFRRRGQQLTSVSRLVCEIEPMLRKLLGTEHSIHFDLPKVASDCHVDRWLGQRILLVLFHYLGTQAKRPLSVVVSGRGLSSSDSRSSSSVEAAALGTKPTCLQLLIDSDLVPDEWSQGSYQPPPFSHPLWAVDVLSREAGALFHARLGPTGLAFELRVPKPRSFALPESASNSPS